MASGAAATEWGATFSGSFDARLAHQPKASEDVVVAQVHLLPVWPPPEEEVLTESHVHCSAAACKESKELGTVGVAPCAQDKGNCLVSFVLWLGVGK